MAEQTEGGMGGLQVHAHAHGVRARAGNLDSSWQILGSKMQPDISRHRTEGFGRK